MYKEYTHNQTVQNNIDTSKMNLVDSAKAYNLNANDKILIVDDFLANGNACLGLIDIVRQAGAEVKGISCCVEKTYQGGYQKLVEK